MMSWLHLLWIIPVTLIVGVIIGYGICVYIVIRQQVKEWNEMNKNGNTE